MEADPLEQDDRAQSQPQRAQGLLGDLIMMEFEVRSRPAPKELADIGKEDCERLRSLGYVEECP